MFKLAELPWPKGALVPHMSQETVEFHYGKHHAAYVNKLNGLVKDTPKANMTLEQLIKTEKPNTPLFNMAAQTWNHTFFWNSIAPNAGGPPQGKIAACINESFGSFDAFKKQFSDVAAGHFGSGWAWVVREPNSNALKIVQSHDANNPMTDNLVPVLTCDVWEHAYYIDYRNDRAKFVEAWWSLVNWEFANRNLL